MFHMFPFLVLVELALYHQCIGGTGMLPPLVMEMQTCSTNNRIFCVLTAPMYWWDWLVEPVLMVRYKGSVMLAAQTLITGR